MLEQVAARHGTTSVTQTMRALFAEFAGLPVPSTAQDAGYYNNYASSGSNVENGGGWGQGGYFPPVVSTQAPQQDIENLRSRLASSDQTVQAQMQQIMYLEEQLAARQQQQQWQQKPQQHYLQYPATIFPAYYGYSGNNNNNGSSGNGWPPQQQSYQQQALSPFWQHQTMTMPSLPPAGREENQDFFTWAADETMRLHNWVRVMRGIGFL